MPLAVGRAEPGKGTAVRSATQRQRHIRTKQTGDDMATIAIFGGTGYAGSAIRDEALRRGHTVISVSRKEAELAGTPGFISRAGNLHDPALVDHMAVEADVLVVATRAGQQDGGRLGDAGTVLAQGAGGGARCRSRGAARGGGPCRRPPPPTRARR